MKKIKNALTHTMVDLKTLILSIVLAIAVAICGTMLVVTIQDNQQPNVYQKVCDVVAQSQETYIVKNQVSGELIEIEKSEMYGEGDTILINYKDDRITSVWLYVDC